MTIREAVNDPDGKTVELTEERWGHIVERHPEIYALGEAVLLTVQKPDRRMPGRLSNEEWYYLEIESPSQWLRVVVAYAEGRGYIVTAHVRRSIP